MSFGCHMEIVTSEIVELASTIEVSCTIDVSCTILVSVGEELQTSL